VLSGVAAFLGAGQDLAASAGPARIGHYYATDSMLLLDPVPDDYDTSATPEIRYLQIIGT
jgi:divinyl chlorophyllide a 8-vinyl-reductase